MGVKKLNNKSTYLSTKLLSNKCAYKEIKVEEEDFYKYLKLLHNTTDGCISLFKSDNKAKLSERYSVECADIKDLECFRGERDFYCSVNTMFAKGLHSSRYVKKLNALMVDLDYYNVEHLKGLNALQVVNLLELELDYPTPSFYVDSGRGVYIIWLLECTYATTKSKKFWRKIETELINYFEDYGADAKVKDPARVLRMVGSINSKADTTVKFIADSNGDETLRYELADLADFFWGSIDLKSTTQYTKSKVKKKKQTKKVIQIKNLLTLNYSRCRDLEKLMELRGNKKQEGNRELLLFVYRLHLLYSGVDAKESLEKTLYLNSLFLDPLDKEEIVDSTENAVGVADTFFRLKDNYNEDCGTSLNVYLYNGGAYIYKNSTLIDKLKITEEEQWHLTTLIGVREKKLRKDARNKEWYYDNREYHKKYYKEYNIAKVKSAGKLTRVEQNKLKRDAIKSLMAMGLSQRAIAKELDLSVSTVNTHIKVIKTEQ